MAAPALGAPDPAFTAGPLLSFDALSNADNATAFGFRVSPPDTNMDVGPNHVVETTNLLVRVYNKSGAPLTSAFKMSSLFTSLGGICSTDDDGDPVVLYDPLANRWMLSQFAFGSLNSPPYHQCVAVSQTADPAGAYFLYDFVVPSADFNDYPHLGVWPDAYYMTSNQFLNGGPFDGSGAYAFDRRKMLLGDPTAGFIYFNLNLASHPEGIGGMLPSDLDGVNPPAAGAPNVFSYFLATEFGDAIDGLRLFDYHVDFATPANSTFTERAESPITVAAFNPIGPTGRAQILQPAPATAAMALDSITDRLMHRLQYRNSGGHETLVGTHTVNVSGGTTAATYVAGVRYYELRRTGGSWSVYDQGTFSPDSNSRWMGSASVDNAGNLAVGFSVSSASVFPSVRYAGRLASDPLGSLAQGEQTLVAGTGVQTSTGSRWGDYSNLAVDPSDDCTFWYSQEYYTAASQATSTVGWLTRIGSFKFSACSPPPANGTLQGVVTSCATGLPLAGALVMTGNGYAGSTNGSGAYSIGLPAGSYSAQPSKVGYAGSAISGLSVGSGGTTTQDFCMNPVPDLSFNSVSISGGNGNGIIEFNECNSLDISLKNIGAAAASSVVATLSTSTPNVTVSQASSNYPNMAAAANANNAVPFKVTTGAAFACGSTIDFTLSVTFAGGTDLVTFSVPTCTAQVNNFSGSITGTDPQQTARLFRDGVATSCASPKGACPGTSGTGTRSYDAYTFTNPSSTPACVKLKLTSGCTVANTAVFGAIYKDSFNPSSICTNYLADQGGSPPLGATVENSFTVNGSQTFVVVVNEINQGTGCTSYTGSVTGLYTGTDGGGPCAPSVPFVATGSASGIGQTTATLAAIVNPNGGATTGFFEYGPTAGYGSSTSVQGLGSGIVGVALPGGGISGLSCGSSYHFRAVATNSVGTTNGADATFTTAGCTAAVDDDLNGDLKSDILWRNKVDGNTAAWIMDGNLITSSGGGLVDPAWKLVGRGQYDAGGKADLLWYNSVSGVVYLWRMDGLTPVAQEYVGTVGDLDWEIVGSSDHDGDGKADILWRNKTSGVVYLWRMNGSSVLAQEYVGTVGDTNWEVVGTGDHDGNGKADILWRNKVSGVVYLWRMNGATVVAQEYVDTLSDLNWEIAGSGDHDGDGKADILWRNKTTGVVYLYRMNGASIVAQEYVTTVGDTNWEIGGSGDYDGNGKADLLWRNKTSGVVYLYRMNGATVLAQEYVTTVGDTNWEIANPR